MANKDIKVEVTEDFIGLVNPSLIQEYGCKLTYDDTHRIMILASTTRDTQQFTWLIDDLYKSTPNIIYATETLTYVAGLNTKYTAEILDKCKTLNDPILARARSEESEC